ncbi:MAG: class I SAM-dependent methyltransferase [Alphaproteobacteria bacterium]
MGVRDSYAKWRRSRLGRITDALEQQLLLELLGDVAGLDVLDVGCGDGALTYALSRRGAHATGLDPDPLMIAEAGARAEAASVSIDLVRGRAEALPFADETFDRVVAVTVLCFIPEPDRAIAEMSRVLKPGGRLVIGELGRWSIWAALRRIRGWLGSSTWSAASFRTARELRRLVERHGLQADGVCGAIYYPPRGLAAALMAPVDPWLGQRTTVGAAFIALRAVTTCSESTA